MKKLYFIALAMLVAACAIAGSHQLSRTRLADSPLAGGASLEKVSETVPAKLAKQSVQSASDRLSGKFGQKQTAVRKAFQSIEARGLEQMAVPSKALKGKKWTSAKNDLSRKQLANDRVVNPAVAHNLGEAAATRSSMSKKPAKAVAVKDIEKYNTWAYYGLLQNQSGDTQRSISVEVTNESTGECSITLLSFLKPIKGTFDASKGTLTIPNMQDMGKDSDGYQNYFYLRDADDEGKLIPGASKQAATVGTLTDGVFVFPELDIWATGDPDNETLGWFTLGYKNTISIGGGSSEEVEWTSLGTCTMNENIIYGMFVGNGDAAAQNTHKATLEIYTDGNGQYAIVDAFQDLYAALNFNSESPDMIIDASNPNDVMIEMQSTGINGGETDGLYAYSGASWAVANEVVDLNNPVKITKTGSGDNVTITIPVKSTLFYALGAQKVYYGSPYETVITFSENGGGETPGVGEGVEAIEDFNEWSFYTLLGTEPGMVKAAIDIAVTNEATGACEIEFIEDFAPVKATYDPAKGTLTIPNKQKIGEDEDGPVYFYLKTMDQEGNIDNGASTETAAVGTLTDGVIVFPELQVWALGDPANETVGFYAMGCLNQFSIGDPAPEVEWTSLGTCTMNENIIYAMFAEEQNTNFGKFEIYTDGNGLYRIVDPFKDLYAAYDFNSASPDMIIDASNPNDVMIEMQSTGINGGEADGLYAYSGASWAVANEVVNLDNPVKITKTVSGDKVTITIPVKSTLFYALGAQKVYYGSPYETVITFSENGGGEDPNPDPVEIDWTPMGTCTMNENIIYPTFTGEENANVGTYELYTDGNGLYMIADAFKDLYAFGNVNEESPAMVIDATDPDNVLIELQTTGVGDQTDGEYLYFSESWYAELAEEELDPDYVITKTVDGDNVTITIPVNACTIYAATSNKFYYASDYETVINFKETSGVESAVVGNDGPVAYYNLQGVRVDNPAKGGIYIRTQGGKASKVAF